MFDALGEAGAGGGVELVVIEAFERGLAAEEAGLGEGEEAPEIEEAVFDGSAGEDEAVGGAEGAGGGRGGAGGVFDVLAFVEDDGVPSLGREGVGVEAELSVVGDQEVSAQGGELGVGGGSGGFGVWGLGFGGEEGRGEGGGGEARAKRAVSSCQLTMTDLGQTTRTRKDFAAEPRDEVGSLRLRAERWRSQVRVWRVLPRPMSSARTPPKLFSERKARK